MNLWLRVMVIGIFAYFRKKISANQTGTTHFYGMPHDVDINIHLNNGRYFEIMDLGRLDLTIRIGIFRDFFLNKWQPLVTSSMIRYHRSLVLFSKYQLNTKIIGIDQKFIYIQQDFIRRDELHARGVIKDCIVKNGQIIEPTMIQKKLGIDFKTEIPDWIKTWEDTNSNFLKYDRFGS